MKKILLSLLLIALTPFIFAKYESSNVIIGVNESIRKLEYTGSSPVVFTLFLRDQNGQECNDNAVFYELGENTVYYDIPRNKLESLKIYLVRLLPDENAITIIKEFSLSELRRYRVNWAVTEIPGKIYNSRYIIPIIGKKVKEVEVFPKEVDCIDIGPIKEEIYFWQNFDQEKIAL